MTHTSSYYRIYLLSVWQESTGVASVIGDASEQSEDSGSETRWRFALEDPRTGQRRGFSNAVDLVALLLTDLESGEPSADKPAPPTDGVGSL